MSPDVSTISDPKSEKPAALRGRPPASRAAILDAAGAVFAAASSAQAVTMEAVAMAAGVGKGTIFRAFGDRDGLLDALVETQFCALRVAVADGEGPFAEQVAPARRLAAFLDQLLDFKLKNRNLMRARETTSTTANLSSERYRWMHDVIARWIAEANPAGALSPSYVAHSLLLLLQVDVVDRFMESGTSVEQLKRQQAHHLAALLRHDARAD